MSGISIKANLEKLARELAGNVSDSIEHVAAMRAGAKAIRGARTQISKQIRSKVSISAADAKKRIYGGRGSATSGFFSNGVSFKLTIDGRQMPAYRFKHTKTKDGVRWKYKKSQWTKYRGAFLATMPGGKKGIWARDSKGTKKRVRHVVKSGKNEGKTTNKSLPITQLYAPPLSQVYKDPTQVAAVESKMDATFTREFFRIMKLKLDKAG